MQSHLYGVQIKFLVDTPSEMTHAVQLVDTLNAAHPIKIPLELQGVTVITIYIPQTLWNMRMKRSQRFFLLQRSQLKIHQQQNTQKRDLHDRSIWTDYHPCNNEKGSSVYQDSYLVFTGL